MMMRMMRMMMNGENDDEKVMHDENDDEKRI